MDGIKIISAENEKVISGLAKWNSLALAKIDVLERQDKIKNEYNILCMSFISHAGIRFKHFLFG